jgi:hypothetical protein
VTDTLAAALGRGYRVERELGQPDGSHFIVCSRMAAAT